MPALVTNDRVYHPLGSASKVVDILPFEDKLVHRLRLSWPSLKFDAALLANRAYTRDQPALACTRTEGEQLEGNR